MKFSRVNGFTLVEMIITVLIVAVLLAVGAPSFSSLIKNNRQISEVYSLRATLNNARSEALARRTFVTVCRSVNGSTCSGGWDEGMTMRPCSGGRPRVTSAHDAVSAGAGGWAAGV